MNYFNHTFFC